MRPWDLGIRSRGCPKPAKNSTASSSVVSLSADTDSSSDAQPADSGLAGHDLSKYVFSLSDKELRVGEAIHELCAEEAAARRSVGGRHLSCRAVRNKLEIEKKTTYHGWNEGELIV